MISYALKAAWFALSLSGLLGSLVALRYSAIALGGYWIPVTYAVANTTMQTTFCLGMIWKMNPYTMPSGFCRLQAALITLSWFAMTGLCAIMTVSTSLTILRARGKLTVVDFQRALEWRPVYIPVFVACVVVFFAIFLAVSLKTHAIVSSDGLQCDVADHVWVRLLGYAGIPLLSAIPSFLLSCSSSILLLSNRRTPSSASPSPLSVPSHKATPRDSFTAVPVRRERLRLSTLATKRATHTPVKRASIPTSELETPISPGPQTPATAVFDPHPEVHEQPAPRTASATPPGLDQIYIVPSRTPSDPARTSVGRAPISPVVARHSRHYHLPFSWRTASTLSLPVEQHKEVFREAEKESGHEREADARPSHSTRSQSRSPTPSSFLPTMTPSSGRTSAELPGHVHAHLHVFPKLMYGQPSSSTFLAELGGDSGYGIRREEHDVFWDEATGEFFYDDENGAEDDIETVSGSMRWARPSFASDETKSPELEFAHRPSTGSGPVMYTYPKSPNSAGLEPAWRNAGLWRTLFFQTLLSATQILGAITSLADIAAHRNTPTPFGTQHVALLLFAWAPTLAFGVLPWRHLVSHVRMS